MNPRNAPARSSGSTIDRREFFAVAGSAALGVHLLAGGATKAIGISEFIIGSVRRVGSEGTKYFEPWIAANPRDASNLVIVGSCYLGKVATKAAERMEPSAWFTIDGGATWSASDFAGTHP